MTFELIILTKDWLVERSQNIIKFEGLYQLINKAYDKVRYKYGIIKTPRIHNPSNLLNDLHIGERDDFCLFLLLGPEKIFDDLKTRENYKRDFTKPSENLNESFSCDLPDQFAGLFQIENDIDLKITVADNDFKVDEKVLNRVLGSAGLRACHDEMKDSTVEELGLTAFTSFVRKTAPKMLDLIINRVLLDPKSFPLFSNNENLDSNAEKIIINADVIKEHKLVEYYTTNCDFKKSDKENLRVEVLDNGRLKNNPWEDGMLASKDFHISFIYREILRK